MATPQPTLTDWSVEPRAGWLHRLIVPQRDGRSSSLAMTVAAAAAVAFVASIALDWRTATVDLTSSSSQGETQQLVLHAGVGDAMSLAVTYLLGMVALLGTVGATLARPDLAARVRMTVLGVGVGLAGVVLAVFVRGDDIQSAIGLNYGGFLPELDDRVKTAPGPGAFLGLAAVALCTAAVWLAGRSAALTAAGSAGWAAAAAAPTRAADGPPAVANHHDPAGYSTTGRTASFDPTVRAGGVFDLTVTPDGQAGQSGPPGHR